MRAAFQHIALYTSIMGSLCMYVCANLNKHVRHLHTRSHKHTHSRWHSINIKDIHHCQLTYAAYFNSARISLSVFPSLSLSLSDSPVLYPPCELFKISPHEF